ncbi:hypothetical protein GCM10027090_09730 [Sinomonas soli]
MRLRIAARAEGSLPASSGSRVPGLVGGADDDAGLGVTAGGAEGVVAGPDAGAPGAGTPGFGAGEVGLGVAGEVGCAVSALAGRSGPSRNPTARTALIAVAGRTRFRRLVQNVCSMTYLQELQEPKTPGRSASVAHMLLK